MNVIQFEYSAFIFPDDMVAFRQRYGVDVIYVDLEQGALFGIGPNDKEWREIPAMAEAKVVKIVRSDLNG